MEEINFNKYIGGRIKRKRKASGISLAQLAELLKLSYQQVQKYESGASKISADKLALISHILSEPIDYFYKDIDFNTITIGSKRNPTIINGTRQNKLQIMLVGSTPADASQLQSVAEKSDYIDKITVEHHPTNLLPYLLNHQKNPHHRLPDVIFMDINLPGADGFELLKRIKSDPTLCHMVVIIFSASVNWEDMVRAYRLGAASYILKSSLHNDLNDTLAHTLDYWSRHVILPNM